MLSVVFSDAYRKRVTLNDATDTSPLESDSKFVGVQYAGPSNSGKVRSRKHLRLHENNRRHVPAKTTSDGFAQYIGYSTSP